MVDQKSDLFHLPSQPTCDQCQLLASKSAAHIKRQGLVATGLAAVAGCQETNATIQDQGLSSRCLVRQGSLAMLIMAKLKRNEREEEQRQANQPLQALRGSPPRPSMNERLLFVVQPFALRACPKQLHMCIDGRTLCMCALKCEFHWSTIACAGHRTSGVGEDRCACYMAGSSPSIVTNSSRKRSRVPATSTSSTVQVVRCKAHLHRRRHSACSRRRPLSRQ